MSGHTLGPWQAVQRGVGRDWYIQTESGSTLGHIYSGTPCDAENARIMATGPELLKVAQATWHLCQSLIAVQEGVGVDLFIEIRDAAKAALTKAGGQ